MVMRLTALALLSTVAGTVLATPIVYDGFDYPTGVLRTNGGWVGSNANLPRPSVVEGSLSYPGVPTSVGNSVQLTNANGTADRISTGSVTTGTLYYSFLLQLSSVSDAAAAISGTGGAFFAGFDTASTGTSFSTTGATFVRRDQDDTSKVNLGIGVTGSAGSSPNKTFSGAYSPGDTLFVVGAFTFNGVATLDIFVSGQAIPSAAPAVHTLSTPVEDTLATQIVSFYLRQNTGEPSTINVDELRIGTAWNDVVPLGGDANLDGRIDADDYGLADRGIAQYLAGVIAPGTAVWSGGDFNGDGAVDAADYMILDLALLAQGGSLSSGELAGRAAAFGDGYVAAIASAVPEPSLVGLAAAAVPGVVRRRTRRPMT